MGQLPGTRAAIVPPDQGGESGTAGAVQSCSNRSRLSFGILRENRPHPSAQGCL